MIDLKHHGIDYDPSIDYSVRSNDLVCFANLMKFNIDTYVLEDLDNEAIIDGTHNIKDSYVVIGGEIAYITNFVNNIDNNTTTLTLNRGKKGTTQEDWTNYRIRSVEIFDDENEKASVIDWSFEDTIGSVSSSLFPVELGSGSINLKSDLTLWSPTSLNQTYRVRTKKTIAYIFKGVYNNRFLKHTTIVNKLGVNTRSKNDINKIRLDIKTRLSTWYEKDLAINQQFKNTKPIEFLQTIFGLKDGEVYYANGVDENSFLNINNLHTKEYSTYSELLKAYCSNGVRFCFDRYERIKVFSDFVVDNIVSQKTIYEDLTESTLTEDENLIYNTINTTSVQRQTLYNMEDLNNKYVEHFKRLEGIISTDRFITLDEDYIFNGIVIENEELARSVQIGDLVCFKMQESPYIEAYSKVVDITSTNVVNISSIRYDKDYKLFPQGKGEYLYNIFNISPTLMDLYFVRRELPMVFKYTRNKNGEEIDASLMMPLLPRVDGETLYQTTTNITFGCASNLKVGSYSNIVEEVDSIYGIWDNSKLLYNKEIEQFSNTEYPPIFVLTNRLNEKKIGETGYILNYTHFDNSNFLLDVSRPEDTNSDATLIMSNTMSINSDTELFVGKELSRIGNRILEIDNISNYSIGDVLIANRPDDLSDYEQIEYDEVISSIRWTITAKTTQKVSDTEYKHYIFIDSDFAKRTEASKVYEFTKFPNWSIVFLQELYLRGNPVIEFSQDVIGISKGLNYENETSREIHEEQKYEFDSTQLSKEDLRKMMGYVLDHFQAVDLNTTKYNLPISVFNGIDIELLDVISVIDPKGTQINDGQKWVVLSVSSQSKTNTVKLKMINLNSSNTKAFTLDVKDVLEYTPIEIPEYSHTGGEGNTEDNNDGTGGSAEDKALGQFWLAEVSTELFRAKVERVEGDYIYLMDFSGEEYEEYLAKLFPVDEFALNINGEVMFVQSDMNYRVYMKKRSVYGTEQVIVKPYDEVSFLVTTMYLDKDGTLFNRKAFFGDGDNYLSVDPIKGVKIVGDFVVGENNQHEGNDLWNVQNNVNTGKVVLNANTTVNGDFKVSGGNVELNGDTKVNGVLEVYGGDEGITSYSFKDRDPMVGDKKIVIKGGSIEFWEWI